jgi:hypothetical protein
MDMIALFAAGATGTAALLGLVLGAALRREARRWWRRWPCSRWWRRPVSGTGEDSLPQLRGRCRALARALSAAGGALLYGAGLGLGLATYLPVSTLIVVAVAVTGLLGAGDGAVVLGPSAASPLRWPLPPAAFGKHEQAGHYQRMAGWASGSCD